MWRNLFLTVAVVATLAPAAGWAAVDRVSDKELSTTIEQTDRKAEKFIQAVDRNLKQSIIRSAAGEKNFGLFLEDFQKSIGRLQKRYTKTYAASEEAAEVLRRGSELDLFVKSQSGMKGEKEWIPLSADLSRLALAYGTEFPSDPTRAVQARRVGDGELTDAIETATKSSTAVAKAAASVAKDKKTSESSRAMAQDFVRLQGQAKTALSSMKQRVAKGGSALAEAEQVVAAMAEMSKAAAGLSLDAKAAKAWSETERSASKIALAFRIEPVAATMD